MIRFLIDADLPRSLVTALRQEGYPSEDIRDLGLGGAPDEVVFHYAVRNGFALISTDKGFTNLLQFPLGSHHGILVARIPRQSRARTKVRLLLRWIPLLEKDDVEGNIVIIKAKGIRIRRAKTRE